MTHPLFCYEPSKVLDELLLIRVNHKKSLGNNFLFQKIFITFASAFGQKAMMAQLVEQRIRNAWVAGSSPARGSFL